ncbi:diguanylate cyclase domain-containing protein [Chloroherpeton thalassium]|uniref:diguanylate cyclase domain-containing protein n=1 Tax=Chloroherpeton thalassium TaxID=100716 RepID=UPI00145DED85|nr:diguanylate cyclase [Chloroherpeton thalassium]
MINVRKYKPDAASDKAKTADFKLDNFPEPSPYAIANAQNGIENELNAVITETLGAVKETLQARTAAYCWSSLSKKTFYIASYVTDSPNFTDEKWLSFAGDVLTQTFLARNAQLYKDISPSDEVKIIRYYKASNAIRSFIGVPVFHGDFVYGILFVDSTVREAFSHDDVKLLNRFANICSALIENYAIKSTHMESLRFVKPAISFMHNLQLTAEIEKATEIFSKSIDEILEFDHLTISLVNSNSELIVKKVVSKVEDSYVETGSKIDLKNSAVGISVMQGQDGTIDDLSTLNGFARFFPDEPCKKTNEAKGSMLIVPIKYQDSYSGVVTLETSQRNYFGKENFAKVRFYVEALSFFLHTKFLEEQLKAITPLDEETGILSRRTFVGRVRHEFNRANRERTNLVLMLIEFDDIEGLLHRYGEKSVSILMRSTARLLASGIRNYDLIGRFDTYKFAVCLINITEINARYWADKIREQILNTPCETEDAFHSILASVSIGLAKLKHEKTDIDMLFEGASKALNHALKTGNSVKVF